MSRYAVVIKSHYWDDFCERQLERIRKAAPSADVFVSLDETMTKSVGDIGQNVVRIQEEDLKKLGLPMVTTDGSVIWYNVDYPHYVFSEKYPNYDYYVFVEYDVAAGINMDEMIEEITKNKIDYVGFPLQKLNEDWPWHPFHVPIYGEKYPLALSCFSVYSKAVLEHLLRRRQQMATAFEAGELQFWPNNEAFIPTEVERGGFRSASLGQFGNVDAFNWWPPTDEVDLQASDAPVLVHPVLSGSRFVRSRLTHEPKIANIINWRSNLYRVDLQRYPAAMIRDIALTVIKRRLTQKIATKFPIFGPRRPWYEGATQSGRGKAQTTQSHNAA